MRGLRNFGWLKEVGLPGAIDMDGIEERNGMVIFFESTELEDVALGKYKATHVLDGNIIASQNWLIDTPPDYDWRKTPRDAKVLRVMNASDVIYRPGTRILSSGEEEKTAIVTNWPEPISLEKLQLVTKEYFDLATRNDVNRFKQKAWSIR